MPGKQSTTAEPSRTVQDKKTDTRPKNRRYMRRTLARIGIVRMSVLELPLMGRYFVSLRLLSSFALPLIAGLLAMPVATFLGLS